MTRYTGRLRCVRCSRPYPETSTVDGCPACREVAPSALLPEYDLTGLTGLPVRADQPGLFRYRELLPLPDAAEPVSLDEGGTPLRALARAGERLGIDRLLLKDETPTRPGPTRTGWRRWRRRPPGTRARTRWSCPRPATTAPPPPRTPRRPGCAASCSRSPRCRRR